MLGKLLLLLLLLLWGSNCVSQLCTGAWLQGKEQNSNGLAGC
jgi:hypothetical protein